MDRPEFTDSGDSFTETIQSRTGLDSREAAQDAIVATLWTLGECIPEPRARAIAEDLSDEFKTALVDAGGTEEVFPIDEFLDRVNDRERRSDHIDEPAASTHVGSVMDALSNRIDRSVWLSVLAGLPPEYQQRWGERSPVGDLSG
ncbi:DUF2267 domain-containing protein [Natrialbaceae archaeon AArc-T1-2]|uniref:DUF2267 domain-containing protein n=1 Tax=Natrialbaceae archaeon AArc-T1-2 TaxID=3053904 RepID=UPI00255AEF97|nr:DUF2267 domain-containing protein [Natrialbaceae archaeon AArc-T1-2]WIV67001.1 DUF2267 domain-containing protein [Natrialbaceae archaeon AArc-T1-2]